MWVQLCADGCQLGSGKIDVPMETSLLVALYAHFPLLPNCNCILIGEHHADYKSERPNAVSTANYINQIINYAPDVERVYVWYEREHLTSPFGESYNRGLTGVSELHKQNFNCNSRGEFVVITDNIDHRDKYLREDMGPDMNITELSRVLHDGTTYFDPESTLPYGARHKYIFELFMYAMSRSDRILLNTYSSRAISEIVTVSECEAIALDYLEWIRADHIDELSDARNAWEHITDTLGITDYDAFVRIGTSSILYAKFNLIGNFFAGAASCYVDLEMLNKMFISSKQPENNRSNTIHILVAGATHIRNLTGFLSQRSSTLPDFYGTAECLPVSTLSMHPFIAAKLLTSPTTQWQAYQPPTPSLAGELYNLFTNGDLRPQLHAYYNPIMHMFPRFEEIIPLGFEKGAEPDLAPVFHETLGAAHALHKAPHAAFLFKFPSTDDCEHIMCIFYANKQLVIMDPWYDRPADKENVQTVTRITARDIASMYQQSEQTDITVADPTDIMHVQISPVGNLHMPLSPMQLLREKIPERLELYPNINPFDVPDNVGILFILEFMAHYVGGKNRYADGTPIECDIRADVKNWYEFFISDLTGGNVRSYIISIIREWCEFALLNPSGIVANYMEKINEFISLTNFPSSPALPFRIFVTSVAANLARDTHYRETFMSGHGSAEFARLIDDENINSLLSVPVDGRIHAYSNQEPWDLFRLSLVTDCECPETRMLTKLSEQLSFADCKVNNELILFLKYRHPENYPDDDQVQIAQETFKNGVGIYPPRTDMSDEEFAFRRVNTSC